MADLDQLSWEILNATADDCENLEQIYGMIVQVEPSQPAKGTRLLGQVADGVRQLVASGLLAIDMDENGLPWEDLQDVSFVWRGWFRMTPEGKRIWEKSAHANLV